MTEPTALDRAMDGAVLYGVQTSGVLDEALVELSRLRADSRELAAMREKLERFKDALEGIRFHGIDKPAAMGGPDSDKDVSWWKSIAYSCMRKAADALEGRDDGK